MFNVHLFYMRNIYVYIYVSVYAYMKCTPCDVMDICLGTCNGRMYEHIHTCDAHTCNLQLPCMKIECTIA